MAVHGDGLVIAVGIGVEMLACLPLVTAALNDVIQVRNDTGGQKALALVVEIVAPRVARAVSENFELVLRRMIAPDARVNRRALIVRRARLADARVRGHAVTAVETAIKTPNKRVKPFI